MGPTRGTERVTTVVAAICIGAALTGPAVAAADIVTDSPSPAGGDSTGSLGPRTPSLPSLGIPGINLGPSSGGHSDRPTSVGPSGDNRPESRFGNGRPSPSYSSPKPAPAEGPQPGPVAVVPRFPVLVGCEFFPCVPPGNGEGPQGQPPGDGEGPQGQSGGQPTPPPVSEVPEPGPKDPPEPKGPPAGTPEAVPVDVTAGPPNKVPAAVEAPASVSVEVPAAPLEAGPQAATIKLTSAVGNGTVALTLILIVLISGVWFYANRLGSRLSNRRNNHA